jgi:UDP-N-acetylglucosamine acyltransferase
MTCREDRWFRGCNLPAGQLCWAPDFLRIRAHRPPGAANEKKLTSNATSQIHPTALIEAGAQLGAGCVIHAYAVVGRHSVLGDGVVVHPFAVIGGDPQDIGFKPATESGVRIGARTVIREHVTVNRATKVGMYTEVGSDCFLMTGCHVAHDCHIGNHVIIANAVLMGGHVHIGDRAFLGGGAVIHQFCRIGESVMIGGGGRISGDVAPFCLATERNTLIGLNLVGMRRRGIKKDAFNEVKRAWHLLNEPVGNLRVIAAAALQTDEFKSAEARSFLEFYQGGKRGFARTRRGSGGDEAGGGE